MTNKFKLLLCTTILLSTFVFLSHASDGEINERPWESRIMGRPSSEIVKLIESKPQFINERYLWSNIPVELWEFCTTDQKVLNSAVIVRKDIADQNELLYGKAYEIVEKTEKQAKDHSIPSEAVIKAMKDFYNSFEKIEYAEKCYVMRTLYKWAIIPESPVDGYLYISFDVRASVWKLYIDLYEKIIREKMIML